MGPTAVSEVTEQIARVIFILVGSYLVLNVFDGTVLMANGIATFAAAIGAIAGILTLWYYWRKRKKILIKWYCQIIPISMFLMAICIKKS